MALPAPTLSAQPPEILNLISTQLGWTDQAHLQRASATIRPAVQKRLQKEHLAQQRFQWAQLLPGILGSNAEENEALLQQLDLGTLELTPGEKEALYLARSSLEAPPVPLTAEQSQVIIDRYLPLYRERMSVDLVAQPPNDDDDAATEADDYRYGMASFCLGPDGPDILGTATRTFDVACLTQAALGECSFENVLRIFAVDGNRYRQRLGVDIHPNLDPDFLERPLLQLIISQLSTQPGWSPVRSPDNGAGLWERLNGQGDEKAWKLALRRGILLGLTIGFGIRIAEGKQLEVSTIPHLPALTQLLSVIGYDFLAGGDDRTYLEQLTTPPDQYQTHALYLFPQQVECLNLVVDRLLVEGKLSSEVLQRLNQFLHADLRYYSEGARKRVQEVSQLLREHLEERGIQLPALSASVPLPPNQGLYIPPEVGLNGMVAPAVHIPSQIGALDQF